MYLIWNYEFGYLWYLIRALGWLEEDIYLRSEHRHDDKSFSVLNHRQTLLPIEFRPPIHRQTLLLIEFRRPTHRHLGLLGVPSTTRGRSRTLRRCMRLPLGWRADTGTPGIASVGVD